MAEYGGRGGRHRPEPRGRGWSWRRIGATCVLLALVLVTGVSSLTSALRVTEPADSRPDITITRPLAITDAPVLLCLLLIAGLVRQDLRRVRVGPDGAEVETRDTVSAEEDLRQEVRELGPKADTYLDYLDVERAEER